MASLSPPDRPGVLATSAEPSVLDLIRLSIQNTLPPGGEALYRKIALLTEMKEGCEVLDAACGRGLSTAFLVSSYGVDGAGVDADPVLVQEAEECARDAGLATRLHFQHADLEDLPYKDEIFDIALGEIGIAASLDPARAIRELARVTKPMGHVVLVQLIWTGNADAARRELLAKHLGVHPMLLVEWKQMLRDAGVVDLLVEDWSDQPQSVRPAVRNFPDLARMFSFAEKMRILRRAMRRWGWRGVRGAVVREQEIHKLLNRQRMIGLSLIKGVKWRNEE